jgi:aryl-alcohol dehydrogenase-like predicted oxidoreductase
MGFPTAPKPKTPLGLHRIFSPTAGVKVSPICLGGISIGHEWKFYTGKNEEPFKLLDAFYDIGGNFIDTASNYNNEMSETLIGQWMEERGVRDQMVIATKYTAGYRAFSENPEPLQSNFTGNSVKGMHVSVRDSLKKLRTDYIDILYVHWWDYATPVEEVMRGLHVLVMQGKVLYLGISNTPAWIVVKANACRSYLSREVIVTNIARRETTRSYPLLCLPGQLERSLPRHGGRCNFHVRGSRDGNCVLGIIGNRLATYGSTEKRQGS